MMSTLTPKQRGEYPPIDIAAAVAVVAVAVETITHTN